MWHGDRPVARLMAGSNAAPGPGSPKHAYAPRRPTETVLYAIVRDHLEAFLVHARESYERALPRYVEQAFRAYLTCGVFAHGFLRLHCDACHRDLLVAFTCQGRGVCPSCAARRMANTAAHIVDRVLPAVPVRQWVLSLPFELRRLAAFRADVTRALGRIFIESVALQQKRAAGITGGRHAAVNHTQRFGGSLNLNLHFHAVFADGVFAPDGAGRIHFHGVAPPSQPMLDRVVRRVRDRTLRWLRKHGLLDARPAEDRSNERMEGGALDACADLALRGGAFASLDRRGSAPADDGNARFERKKHGPFTAELDGFNVQAAVRIEADDDEGRERLVRYCARPCFALDRLSLLPDGRIAYRVKYGGRGGTHRVMTPVELLARLAALVPPPRYPLVIYHGVLAPHSKWRSAVVPRPPGVVHAHDLPASGSGTVKRDAATPASMQPPTPKRASPGPVPPRARAERASAPGGAAAPFSPQTFSSPPLAAAPAGPAAMPATCCAVAAAAGDVVTTDFGISVRHLDRLLGGLLLATSPRIDWAKLIRRTFGIDALRCAHCAGRLRLLAAITEKATARKILEHLGLPADPTSPRSRTRDPDDPASWMDGAAE